MKPNQIAKQRKLDEIEKLLQKPMTATQIIKATGYSRQTLLNYIKDLRDEGRIYIARWVVGQCLRAAVYKAGSLPDVPPPPTRRNRDIPVVYPTGPFRDWLTCAFYGEYRKAA
ncbi:MAG TPA: helix-turn-helix domain-containing protein [Noviherbaspirillum sp.]|nr:helix-turn-helix domain-containing protein [Noviherbaspirillum sp.]